MNRTDLHPISTYLEGALSDMVLTNRVAAMNARLIDRSLKKLARQIEHDHRGGRDVSPSSSWTSSDQE